jgi:hypothetical protein
VLASATVVAILGLSLASVSGCVSGPPWVRAAKRACGGDRSAAVRLMADFDLAAARALAAKPELTDAARSGFQQFADEHYLEAAEALIPELGRAGPTHSWNYQAIEFHVAQALLRSGLYLPAAQRFLTMIESEHPYELGAIQGVLVAHALILDPQIADALDKRITINLKPLPKSAFERYFVVIGMREVRRRRIPEGLSAFQSVPVSSTEDGARARNGAEVLAHLLSVRALNKDDPALENGMRDLEQSLHMIPPAEEAELMRCEMKRELDLVGDDVPPGVVQDELKVAIERYRR